MLFFLLQKTSVRKQKFAFWNVSLYILHIVRIFFMYADA